MCGPELEGGKPACWLVREGAADSPCSAGATGLKLPADIRTVAAGLIACLSSLKGNAAVHFRLLPSAFMTEQSGVGSKKNKNASALFEHLGLFYIFALLVSDLAECIDPCMLFHT